MFHIRQKIAVAAFLVGMAPLAVMAQSGRDAYTATTAPDLQTNQQAQPSRTSTPMYWQMPAGSTQPTQQLQQQQISEISPAVAPDARALQAPQDRNWVFRDPRLEP